MCLRYVYQPKRVGITSIILICTSPISWNKSYLHKLFLSLGTIKNRYTSRDK
jgi:hypothetical protein